MRARRPLLPLVAFAAFLTLSNAGAMCVYHNVTSVSGKVRVTLICGVFCNNVWDLGYGQYACRPDKHGTISGQTLSDPEDWNFGSWHTLRVPDSHGYVVLSNASNGFGQACSYNSDDSLVACVPFGPNSVQ